MLIKLVQLPASLSISIRDQLLALLFGQCQRLQRIEPLDPGRRSSWRIIPLRFGEPVRLIRWDNAHFDLGPIRNLIRGGNIDSPVLNNSAKWRHSFLGVETLQIPLWQTTRLCARKFIV